MTRSNMPTRAALPFYALFFIAHLIALPTAHIAPDVFSYILMREDGPYEWATAIFLFIAGLMLIHRGRQLGALGLKWQMALSILYALLYIFVAGEEISWGQRIFDWQSGEFFVENNFQSETNIHNLVIGDEQLAKTLFGSWLTLALLLYLIVLPLIYRYAGWAQRLGFALAVPVPRLRHAVLALLASISMGLTGDAPRQFELYEFAFSLISMIIFLEPRNIEMYRTGTLVDPRQDTE